MNEISIARRNGGGGGLAVVAETIAPHRATFAIAQRCADWNATLPQVRDLASARIVRTELLPNYQSIDTAQRELTDMMSCQPDQPVTESLALRLLSTLYGALSKRSGDALDAAALLRACVEMLTDDDTILRAARIEPLPKHPVVLALGVKRLLATKVFAPAPVEVRKALFEVRDRLLLLRTDVSPLLKMMRKAEQITFRQARDEWALPYSSGALPLAVAIDLVAQNGEDPEWWNAIDALQSKADESGDDA